MVIARAFFDSAQGTQPFDSAQDRQVPPPWAYTVRQLFDLQQGVRKGPWSALMKSAAEKLTIDDMIAITAYTSSREP